MRAYCIGHTVYIELDDFNELREMNVIIKRQDPTALEPMEMEPELVKHTRKAVRRERLGPKRY
jgi:hypothetical protein